MTKVGLEGQNTGIQNKLGDEKRWEPFANNCEHLINWGPEWKSAKRAKDFLE